MRHVLRRAGLLAALACCAPFGEGRRAAALGELLAGLVDQQRVVMPPRHRQAEQRLERAVDMGGCEQIGPARHQRHPVGGIIERDG